MLCNRYIKFLSFPEKALSIGADKVATGHYATIDSMSGTYMLRKGKDKSKDQSYFLYPIKKDLLEHVLFPLGSYTKKSLREQVSKLGWDLRHVKESQDVCFIPENDYRYFLSSYLQLKPGPVYHIEGKLMGKHNGIHLYTIGQRKGLNIPFKEPLYVVEIIPEENRLIVGPREYLKRKRLVAENTNMFDVHRLGLSSGYSAKVRYRQKEEPCAFTVSGDVLEVDFHDPVYSITPGQSVVIYSDDVVVGGGIIKSSG